MSLLRPDLANIQPYTRPASESEGADKVRLHMNEAASDWPAEARKALLERLSGMPFHRYPERQAEITERLRLRLGAPEGGLVLGPSSGNVLDLVAIAGLSPGDLVAYPDPVPGVARQDGGGTIHDGVAGLLGGALDLLGGFIPHGGLVAVGNAAHVDLGGRRALAGEEAFRAENGVKLAVFVLDDIALAD